VKKRMRTPCALSLSVDDLDSSILPARAFGGNWYLVLAVKTKQRLDDLHYDFEKLKKIMLEDNLTTLQLIWRENDDLIHSRNPFPVGGVVEDPATALRKCRWVVICEMQK
jgi:predicted PhzF superfamily epimerase YddE/YHI9